MPEFKANLLIVLLLQFGVAGALSVSGQGHPSARRDVLTPLEKKEAAAVAAGVAKRLQQLQQQANARVMGRLSGSRRNTQLACSLAHNGSLKEREGTDVGIVSYVSSQPQDDPALLQLVSFPSWRLRGEYGFHHFDVAVWPDRKSPGKERFAVRIEMRQGLYDDWADSHITDDSLNKNWWRSLVAPECK
jgi:hypothetical protein